MYAKKYKNKKGEEKVEVLLSLDEARRAVETSPSNLIDGIRRAIGESLDEATFIPRGAPGRLEGLEMLFDDTDDSASTDDG